MPTDNHIGHGFWQTYEWMITYHVMRGLWASQQTREDAMQEAWLVLVETLTANPDADQPLLWRTIDSRMRREKRHQQRDLSRTLPLGEDEDDGHLIELISFRHAGPSAEDHLDAHQTAHHLHTWLRRRLSPVQYRCLCLRARHGLSVEETSAALGLSTGVVKNETSRALKKISAMARERGIHDEGDQAQLSVSNLLERLGDAGQAVSPAPQPPGSTQRTAPRPERCTPR